MADLRAWVEIDLGRWRRNFELINADKPPALKIAAVLKDDAYGHGAVEGARVASEAGVACIALGTVDEALALRKSGFAGPILLLGQRLKSELQECVSARLICCVHENEIADALSSEALKQKTRAPVHVEIDTGLSRYGVRWTEAAEFLERVARAPGLDLQGAMSHFAMSDELDKTFARLQMARFQEALDAAGARGIFPKLRHFCNSGGFLDLPLAHYEMARMGILPLGVYPSQVCRRIPGLEPVMSVKTRVAMIRNLEAGDKVGYGMRYTATAPRRIAVLPIGYGDGFPRVRNEGFALIAGKRAPLVGGVSMDAITVDVTDIPAARMWDEAVIMGRQGADEITVHELAALKKSVSYDVLTSWRARLPRICVNASKQSPAQ